MANANAALLDGKPINYQAYFPHLSTPYGGSNNGDKVVGVGVEAQFGSIRRPFADIDISDTNIYIDFSL
ncbi:MAG: hypothetical protein Q9N32_00345 [Gammaproteobacteria bacterium]|nr:hypothetical protein [Gammaproteobacteria bacterium]